MTEINHVLTFPIKKYERSYDDRIETMERLLDFDNRLKREGISRLGIYNKKCMITLDDNQKPIAICRATTYGDLDWLKKQIEKEPFIKKKPLMDEFDVTEEELKQAKEFRKLYD